MTLDTTTAVIIAVLALLTSAINLLIAVVVLVASITFARKA